MVRYHKNIVRQYTYILDRLHALKLPRAADFTLASFLTATSVVMTRQNRIPAAAAGAGAAVPGPGRCGLSTSRTESEVGGDDEMTTGVVGDGGAFLGGIAGRTQGLQSKTSEGRVRRLRSDADDAAALGRARVRGCLARR